MITTTNKIIGQLVIRSIIYIGVLLIGIPKINLAQENNARHSFSADLGISFFQPGDPDHFYDSWGGEFSYANSLFDRFKLRSGFAYYQSSNKKVAVFSAGNQRAENLDETFLKSSSELFADAVYSLIDNEKSILSFSAGIGLQFYRGINVYVISSSTIIDSNTGEVLEIRIVDETSMTNETTPGFRFGGRYYYKLGRSFAIGPVVKFRSYSGIGRNGEDFFTIGASSSVNF